MPRVCSIRNVLAEGLILQRFFLINRIGFDGHMRLLSNQLKNVQNFVKNCLYICNAGAIKIDQKNYYMYLS